MFSASGPGSQSFTHTGAGVLSISSTGVGVSVQGIGFQGGDINLSSAGSLYFGGEPIVDSLGLHLGPDNNFGVGHVEMTGEAYLPNLPGSDAYFPVGLEFNKLLPCVPGMSEFDCATHPMRDGTLRLNLPGGLWINGAHDDPETPFNETTVPLVYVTNGVQIVTGASGIPDDPLTQVNESLSGVVLPPGGGAWDTLSDARRKTDWEKADPELFLRGIAGMDIRSWRYTTQTEGIRHVGPTAQDFRAAFGLGTNDTTISTVDADGANMLAIQALAKRTDELKAATERITELEKRLAEIESLLREMRLRQ